MVMEAYAEHYEVPLVGSSVVIQGFGNVGRYAALHPAALGAKVIAVSDSKGAIYNSEGLDIAAVIAHKNSMGTVSGLDGAEIIDHASLLALPCDYLIPAALGGAINSDNVATINARVIVEAASSPVTWTASDILNQRGVRIIPDVLASSGGVTVSYFEWVQNLQFVSWTLDHVRGQLREKMNIASKQVFNQADAEGTLIRNAAYQIATERLKQAIFAAGI